MGKMQVCEGDLVKMTAPIVGTPIPAGARGHIMSRWSKEGKTWIVDFHNCYGETPWEIPESKFRKVIEPG